MTVDIALIPTASRWPTWWRPKYPEVTYLPRGGELGGDRVPKMAVFQDTLRRMEQRAGQPYTWHMDLDITSPLRTAADVENAVAAKRARPDLDLVFSVTEARRKPLVQYGQGGGRPRGAGHPQPLHRPAAGARRSTT